MIIELTVILSVALAVPGSVVLLWRRGIRGRRLIALGWLSLFGFVLTIMMLGHCADIVRNLSAGGQAMDGALWGYTFRTYALFLLAGLLLTQGLVILRSVVGLSRGEVAAWSKAIRATLSTLAVVVPLIPIHRFFAVPGTAMATLSLLALLLLARGSAEPTCIPGETSAAAASERAAV